MAKNGNGNGSSNGNGNGKAPSVASVLESAFKYDVDGKVIVDDLVPASVLLMFFVQKLGKASFDQIKAKVASAAVVMDEHLMRNALDALQARQFLSYAKGKAAGGEVVDMWKPRKANFSGMPDTAQVSQAFLSSLVSTKDAEEMLTSLNASEEEGDGRSKAKEKLKYADYYMAEITFKTSTTGGRSGILLGGRPSSPFFDSQVQRGPRYPGDAKLRFARNFEGKPVIPFSNMKGWLADGLRSNNIGETAINYITMTGGLIEYPGKIQQHAQPVVDMSGASRGAGGLGITTYEVIDAGATFKFTFTVPRRGLFTFTQFVGFLIRYAATSSRGLSNARSNEHGYVEIADAKFLGETRMAKASIEAIMDNMSPEAQTFASKFLAELGDRDVDLFVGKHVEVE